MTYSIKATLDSPDGDAQTGGLDVTIYFDYHKGFKGDHIDPPEPAFCELASVEPKGDFFSASAIWAAAEQWLEDNMDRALEVVYAERDEAEERKAESRRERLHD